MNEGIGCQPFRDVLVVRRRPAFVGAVREEPRAKTRAGSIGQQKDTSLQSWALPCTVGNMLVN